jgi:hypothetical protein
MRQMGRWPKACRRGDSAGRSRAWEMQMPIKPSTRPKIWTEKGIRSVQDAAAVLRAASRRDAAANPGTVSVRERLQPAQL